MFGPTALVEIRAVLGITDTDPIIIAEVVAAIVCRLAMQLACIGRQSLSGLRRGASQAVAT